MPGLDGGLALSGGACASLAQHGARLYVAAAVRTLRAGIMSTYPRGLVGVLSGELSRWTWFQQSLLALKMPAGSHVEWVSGQWVSTALNMLIQAMEPEDEFFVIIPDDHVFDPDMLLRLLDHHVDIVAPLCCLRRLPYAPALFHETTTGYRGYTWPELKGSHGLLPVDTMGGPLCVIRRRVLDAIGAPWFQSQPGDPNPCEDLYFFSRARKLGFQPYCDLESSIGHIMPAATFPQRVQHGAFGVRIWSHTDLAILSTEAPLPPENQHYHAYT